MGERTLTERERLAIRVLDLAKATALADNHFLSAAVGRLRVEPGSFVLPLAANGYALGFDAERVLAGYMASGEPPKHDLLHSVMHCVFLHPYVGPEVDRAQWNLACDIAAERAVAELCGARPGDRGACIAEAIGQIESDCGRRASAEAIYQRLRAGEWAGLAPVWTELFLSDDHAPWYGRQGGGQGEEDGAGAEGGPDARGSTSGNQDRGRPPADGQGQGGSNGDGTGDSKQGDFPHDAQDGQDGFGQRDGQDGQDGGDGSPDPGSGQGAGAGSKADEARSQRRGLGVREISRPGAPAGMRGSREDEQAGWRRVAKALAVNLQTVSKARGKGLAGVVGDLEEATRERVDYRDFLRQFAIPGEVMRLSDDEFDYVFYTYGMKLYGNLPLIEPLEYREEKRIREFAIVIDTSGSVWGDTVRRFIDTTFDILKSTEAFFERVNVRIIQCDAEVQSDDKIASLDELKEWGRTMRLHGGGGTDFAPAFRYVDGLVEAGEFENLGGLIYFTDGWGDYPDWMPDYKTAFVFYDEGYRPDIVPPWAIQVVLDDDAIGNAAAGR